MRTSEIPPLSGSLRVPGDKSISHRALIMAVLAAGRSRVSGLNGGADVRATAACLGLLGARIEWDENSEVIVDSSGYAGLGEPDDVLDAGNSGTTMRLLSGVCAALPGLTVITGDASLRGRPMERIALPLRAMGAVIDGRNGGRLPPLSIRGGDLTGIDHASPVASAQVKSALLLAGLRASGTTSVVEPTPSRDHTERMLLSAGVRVGSVGGSVSIEGGQEVSAAEWSVPGDISSAFYLIVAACLTPGSELRIEGVGLNATRIGGLEVLRDMGADVSWSTESEACGEPSGTIVARYSELHGTSVAGATVPRCIDEIPALAVAATQAHGTTVFSEVGELRVKESDRLHGLAQMLRALGARADVSQDSLIVEGPSRLAAAPIESHGDHRMALAGAVAGSIAAGDVHIGGWSAVETSFPEFIDLFAAARGRR